MDVPAAAFDAWYEAIERSPRWDAFVQHQLGLPPDVWSSGYLNGAGLAEVGRRLQLTPQSTLVELGCGRAGYGMALIRASGAQLVGIDFSSAALAAAVRAAARLQLSAAVRLSVGDLQQTGLRSGCADAVLCVDAFHFARSSAVAAAECRRLLAPGGRLVITSWQPATPGDPALPVRLRHLDIRRDLVGAGLVDVETLPRPAWSASDTAFWRAAAAIEPAGDPALADLREEAEEFLPLAGALRRVLVVARAAVG